MSNLPHYTKQMPDWTDVELAEMIAFRQHELATEWCATLILQDLDILRAEQERRAFRNAVNGPPSLLGVRIENA